MKKSVWIITLAIFCFFGVATSIRVDAAEVEYTVAFDPDDGSTYSSWFKTQVEDGGLITETPPDPVKEGYTFLGWYHTLDVNGNPIFWNFSEDPVSDNITLWAAYEQTHTIVFDPDNGTSYPSWFKTQVEDGGLITETPPDPVKEGYEFLGWYRGLDNNDNPIFWNFSEDRVTDNITLWAAYKKLEQVYTVTFDPDDGSSYPSWFKTQVEANGLVTETPADPEKSGYRFIGWYHALDKGGNPIFWNFSENRVTDNTTLWAAYSKIFLVIFDPQNGSPENEWTKLSVDNGAKIGETVPVPKRAGYQFIGWSKINNEQLLWNFNLDTVNEDRTLYAIWEKEQETVTSESSQPGKSTTTSSTKKEPLSSTSETNKQLPKAGSTNSSFYISLLGLMTIVSGLVLIKFVRL